jgi:hypothetical protein
MSIIDIIKTIDFKISIFNTDRRPTYTIACDEYSYDEMVTYTHTYLKTYYDGTKLEIEGMTTLEHMYNHPYKSFYYTITNVQDAETSIIISFVINETYGKIKRNNRRVLEETLQRHLTDDFTRIFDDIFRGDEYVLK